MHKEFTIRAAKAGRIMEAICQSAKDGKPVKFAKINGIDVYRGTPPKEES